MTQTQLTPHEARTVAAALARLVPGDESTIEPVASRAAQAMGAFALTLPAIDAVLADGVSRLDAAVAHTGTPFADLVPVAQRAALTKAAGGSPGGAAPTALGTTFIGMLRRFAIAAWLTEPGIAGAIGSTGRSALEGGNPDFASPPPATPQDATAPVARPADSAGGGDRRDPLP